MRFNDENQEEKRKMQLTKGGKRMRSVTALVLAAVMAIGMAPSPVYAAGDTYTVNVSSVNVRASASTDGKVIAHAARGENVEVTGTSGNWYKVKYDGQTGYIRKDMLVEGSVATSSSSTPTAKVTGSSVNIRKSASTGATVLKRVDKGTVLEAVSISDGWVKVKYDGVTGYVSADYVSVTGLSSSSGSSDNLTEMDREGVINASEVNVRSGASTSSSKLYSLKKGAEVDVTGLKGDWYRVHTSSGTGYVLAKYVTLSSSSGSSGSDSTSSSLTSMDASGTISGNGVNVLAMGAFYVAPQMGCDIADAYLGASLGSGYEWWHNFYEFHKLAIDELEAFNYVDYKANGFKLKHLGDYPLKLETKPE